MLKPQFIISLLLLSLTGTAQSLSPVHITSLSDDLSETSGLVWIDGELWTHNDSGAANELHCIDTITGNISRTVSITNASSIDWEDITTDNTHLYIGDFGNNGGNRTDLCIYKVNKSFVYQDFDETIAEDTIQFYYPNQNLKHDNNPWKESTNFDCEAMIAFGDSLYLFSKNWGNNKTFLYSLPKQSGNYTATLLDSLNVEGLITAADIDTFSNRIVLLGYSDDYVSSFIWLLQDFSDQDFFSGHSTKIDTDLFGCQVEGIAWKDSLVYFSHESISFLTAGLYRSALPDLNPIPTHENKTKDVCFYPNPAKNTLHFEHCGKFQQLTIFDINGKTVITYLIETENFDLPIPCLRTGTYTIELSNLHTNDFHIDLLIID